MQNRSYLVLHYSPLGNSFKLLSFQFFSRPTSHSYYNNQDCPVNRLGHCVSFLRLSRKIDRTVTSPQIIFAGRRDEGLTLPRT